MYLSKLEILGFKSFAQKTAVHFNQGITSIVGPNGCGKTNIVDAIRWCLGEQKPSILRSDKMENVIFNGTSAHKPMGLAEVSLIIQNDRGILPTEYSEVIITRRIYRSGESEYLLNKNVSRLKDITSLFMDTGMGANAYSVIELKMVESILSNKAEDRRILFEEAAGVNKYKTRRKLTLKRLEDVKGDLARVNDIISEVEKQVNSLERQAKKAERHKQLTTRLMEIELILGTSENQRLVDELQILDSEIVNLYFERSGTEEILQALEDEFNKYRDDFNAAEKELNEFRQKISSQTSKVYETEKSLTISTESKKSLLKNIERLRGDVEDHEIRLESTRENIEELEIKERELANQLSEREEEKDSYSERISAARIEVDQAKTALNEKNAVMLTTYRSLADSKNELNNILRNISEVQKNEERNQQRYSAITSELVKLKESLKQVTEEKDALMEEISERDKKLNYDILHKQKLEKRLESNVKKDFELRTSISELENKIAYLTEIMHTLEGVSKGIKTLIESRNWKEGEVNLLANIGETDDIHRVAVESALQNNLNTILIEGIDELKNAVEILNSGSMGKVSFALPVTGSYSYFRSFTGKAEKFLADKRLKKLESEKGVKGRLADFVKTSAKNKNYFQRILERVYLVDSLETGIHLAKKYPDSKFVSAAGDFVTSSGLISAGSEIAEEDSVFGRKIVLDQLKADLQPLRKQQESLTASISELEALIASIDLVTPGNEIRQLNAALTELEKKISRLNFEKEKLEEQIALINKEKEDLAARSEEFEKSRVLSQSAYEEITAVQTAADSAKQEAESAVKKAEAELQEIISQKNSSDLETERLKGSVNNIITSLKRSRESIDYLTESISKKNSEIERSSAEIEILDENIENLELDLDDLKRTLVNLKEASVTAEANYREIKAKTDEIEVQKRKARSVKDQLSDKIHRAELDRSDKKHLLDSILSRLEEKYNLSAADLKVEIPEDFNADEARREVKSLEQQILNLGAINSLAFEEYQTEKERFDSLNGQKIDLIEAEKNLLKTIEEINDTAQKLFLDTFEQIKNNFINIFRRLFNPGDEADLRLEEDTDPLEAKIEIIAKPRGKRPTSIDLLSGGEKTLTAIALLFAIYLVKPSPFCILDEIDAPLDDANIDRFTRILRDFSATTQFIVVTHNKRTMEAADTLYGVTMQEEGISKLVSVRFNEDFKFVG